MATGSNLFTSHEAKKLVNTYGSGTQPVYINSGVPTNTTYTLGSSVAAGTASRLAYFSGANTISAGSVTTDGGYLGNVSYLSVNTAHQTGYRLYVNGKTKIASDSASGDGTGAFLELTSTNTSFGGFYRIINHTAASLPAGKNTCIMFGKDANRAGQGYINYQYNGEDSDSNQLTFGFNNYDHLVRIYKTGNVAIGADNNSYKLYVNGTSFFTNYMRLQHNTPTLILKNTNASSYSIIRLWNSNADSGTILFQNGPSRTDDGGQNVFTIRNDVGPIRLDDTVYTTGTLYLGCPSGSYTEGIRLNAADGAWVTIALGTTSGYGGTSTNANCWSIHRKSDNNFCISRNSSDGANGLVMTSTGMGLGTTAPAHRLHVVGTVYSTGQPGFYNSVAAGSWSYVRLHNGSNFWDVATNRDYHSGALEFRPNGANTSAYVSTSAQIYGAVWNDYAEYRQSDIEISPGHIVQDNDNGTMTLADARLIPGAQVVSDTFGFAIGETDESKTPIAVSGRALVYTYQDRYNYHAGMTVCSAPGGTVDIMTREEIKEYPDCIIGIVSEIPEYETWGSGNVAVDGRIWIKVR